MKIKIDKRIKSLRKSVSIEINHLGQLIVRTPLQISEKYLEHLLDTRQEWIISKQNQMRQKQMDYGPRKFIHGEKFLYLGEERELTIATIQDRPLILTDNGFSLREKDCPWAAELFKRWYKRQATSHLFPRLEQLSTATGINYRSLKITNAEKRWGSCSAKHSLCLSWRIMMVPQWVIDYIIIHELVHIKHLNHSPEFWKLVTKKCPDYKKAEEWLKKNSYKCHIIQS